MRIAVLAAASILIAAPAFAQPAPYGYGAPPSAHDWHAAHHADEVARERAAVGDYEGAARAHAFAQRKRAEARDQRDQGQ